MSKGLNVLFSYNLLTAIFNLSPHIGLYRLKGYLEDNGHSAEVFDPNIDAGRDDILERVRQGEFDIVGFSVAHSGIESLDWFVALGEAAQQSKKRCLFIGGGEQATHNPDFWMEYGVELLFLGYAEKQLLQFCDNLASNPDKSLVEVLQGVDGVIYRQDDGKKVVIPRKKLTQEEFEFLSYDRVLKNEIPFHTFWEHNRNRIKELRISSTRKTNFIVEYIQLYSTSHCPGKCGFCSTTNYLEESQGATSPVIMLPADKLFDVVLTHVKKYDAKLFSLCEDNFVVGSVLGVKRVIDFCHRIIDAKKQGLIPSDVAFYCQCRIDNFLKRDKQLGERVVNHELLEAMGKAGFNSLSFGVETFSDRLLRCPSVNKGITAKECHDVLEAAIDYIATPQLNLILGVPETTVDEIIENMTLGVEYLKKGYSVIATPLLLAYPGAPLVHSPDYKKTFKDYELPKGSKYTLADYFIPHDERIHQACLAGRLTLADEVERLRKFTPWASGYFPRMLYTIMLFIIITRNLGEDALRKDFEAVFFDMVPDGPHKNLN